jgi:urease accessory protein
MKRTALLATLFTLAGAAPAFAHTGTGIASGFAHPFLGWDHLLAMLAVGAWGAMVGNRALWAVPGAFVSAMALGGATAMMGVTLPFVEAAIFVSVLVLGAFLLARVRMPVWAGMAVAGLFALAHGHAHGAEVPLMADAWIYGFGFVTATALIHALGAIAARFALRARRRPGPQAPRLPAWQIESRASRRLRFHPLRRAGDGGAGCGDCRFEIGAFPRRIRS